MLTGDAAGHVEGTRFGFSLDCDNDAFDTTFTLAPDGTFTTRPIPVGTTCTIAETIVPSPAAGFSCGDPTFTPDPPTVTITTAGQVVTVQFTNTLIGLKPPRLGRSTPARAQALGRSPAPWASPAAPSGGFPAS